MSEQVSSGHLTYVSKTGKNGSKNYFQMVDLEMSELKESNDHCDDHENVDDRVGNIVHKD